MATELSNNGIKTKLVADSNIALELEKVDFVLSGAEAVAANGGIINKVLEFYCNYNIIIDWNLHNSYMRKSIKKAFLCSY